MELREITENEVDLLYKCVAELSAYHNEISVNFSGIYPKRDYKDTLEQFKRQLASGASRVAVIGDKDVCGFCKIDMDGAKGKLDYLIVAKEHRGKGCGRALMDWAMKSFEDNKVSAVEVKVIDGNPTIHLYQKYGFRTEAYILRREL